MNNYRTRWATRKYALLVRGAIIPEPTAVLILGFSTFLLHRRRRAA